MQHVCVGVCAGNSQRARQKLQSVQLWCKLPNLCAASRIMCTSSAGMVLTLPADAAWYNHEATSERPMANASDASGVACIAEVHPCFEVLEQGSCTLRT